MPASASGLPTVEGGEKVTDDGNEKAGTEKLSGVRPAPVFDISQINSQVLRL